MTMIAHTGVRFQKDRQVQEGNFLGWVWIMQSDINVKLMRFFRDLSRSKAHRRLHNKSNALVTVVMGREEMLPISEPDDSTPTFTVSALRHRVRVSIALRLAGTSPSLVCTCQCGPMSVCHGYLD